MSAAAPDPTGATGRAALLLTAFDRPHYLAPVLDSWTRAHAFSPEPAGAGADALVRGPAFCPWVWGAWRDRWLDVVGPTWDRDHSTYNGSPGFETGWDWNLDTRVFPAHGLVAVAPRVSRVRNIGEVGEHGTPEDLVPAPSFVAHQPVQRYREA